jgi:hypothetical protein
MTVSIFVQNQRHELTSNEVTADVLRRLGNIPPDNKILRESPADEADSEVSGGPFLVYEGEKFYAVPPGNRGHGS